MRKISLYFAFLGKPPYVSFEKYLVSLSNKTPKLSDEIITLLVTIAPYLALIGGVANILSSLNFYTFHTVVNDYSISMVGQPKWLASLETFLSGVLLIVSFEDLQKKVKQGWRLIFWSSNISIIYLLTVFQWGSALITALLVWYILIQVYPRYR